MKRYNKLNKVKLFVNGLDAKTGENLTRAIKLKSLVKSITKRTLERPVKYIPEYYSDTIKKEIIYNVVLWKKHPLNDVKKAGWGIIVLKKRAGYYTKLLREIIRLRRGKIYYYYSGETPFEFIARYNLWDSYAKEIPHYLLIAGDINEVPLSLQVILDAQFSVGRLYFEKPEEYRMYVNKIKKYKPSRKKRILFFATEHPGDEPTYYSRKYLVRPLMNSLKEAGFEVMHLIGDEATEKNLIEATREIEFDIIFSATHGLGLVSKNFEKQKKLQGAIICQDIEMGKNLLKQNKGLLTGLDIEQKKKTIRTKIFFMFACYSGGTLKNSDFLYWVPEDTKKALKEYQAKQDFLAYLPQKLLASPEGPLNVIAHVDPAWVFSFMDDEKMKRRTEPFKNALKRILSGVPAGRAIRDFNLRTATLSVALLDYVIDHLEKNEKINPLSLSNIWITRQDAKNYILFGDPAFSL